MNIDYLILRLKEIRKQYGNIDFTMMETPLVSPDKIEFGNEDKNQIVSSMTIGLRINDFGNGK